MAAAAVEALAEPVMDDGVGEGESLIDVGERDEGLPKSGGKSGVLGEFLEQVGNGGAMLRGGSGDLHHLPRVSREGRAVGRVGSL